MTRSSILSRPGHPWPVLVIDNTDPSGELCMAHMIWKGHSLQLPELWPVSLLKRAGWCEVGFMPESLI